MIRKTWLIILSLTVFKSTSGTKTTKWINLGCYKDIKYSRALPHPFKMIDVDYERVYPDLKQIFDVCRREAERHGFHYFGIQFYSECWGGNKEDQYDKYGNSTECGIGTKGYGVGFVYTNYVYGRALSVNGGWSSWSAYSHCSKPCGGGTQLRRRWCNNPYPQYGGDKCHGSSQATRSCPVHHCPDAG